MDITNAIKEIAKENGVSEAQVRADMIVAIHQAYLAGKPEFKVLFGDREPSVEEFICETEREVWGERTLH